MFRERSRREDFGWIAARADGTIGLFDRDAVALRGVPDSSLQQHAVTLKDDFPGLRAPVTAGLELTLACNLTCKHCYISAGDARAGELSTGEILRNVAILADAGVMFAFVTGGEVTLRPDFVDIIRGIDDSGIDFNIISNGTGLSRDTLRQLPPQATFVMSVDGISSHRLLRGQQTFEQITTRMKAVRAHGFPVIGSTVVNRLNLPDLPALYRWAAAERMIVTVLDVQMVGRARQHAGLLKLAADDLDGYRRFLDAKLEYERLLPALYDENFGGDRVFSNPHYYGLEEELMLATGLNYQGNFYIYVAADGTVYPDNFYAGERLYASGVLGQEDFAQIWDTIKRQVAVSNYDQFDCAGCPVHEAGLFCDFKSAALSLYLHGAPNVCGADDVEKTLMLLRHDIRPDTAVGSPLAGRHYDNF
jgi:MoaA/NifB/PqqE/SkfB family radical SAM enzyme